MARTTVVRAAQKDQGTCENCGDPIKVGDGYKWIAPRLPGSRSSTKRKRCATCPGWHEWDYSNSLSARIAQIQHNTAQALSGSVESEDDVRNILEEAATAIEELAQEKRDSAESIESGFQHPTSQSEELAEQADSLESWAQEVRDADIPDFPEPEEEDCDECGGTGSVDIDCAACKGDGVVESADHTEQVDCEACKGEGTVEDTCGECSGAGTITPDDPTDEQVDAWREEAEQAVTDALDNSPV